MPILCEVKGLLPRTIHRKTRVQFWPSHTNFCSSSWILLCYSYPVMVKYFLSFFVWYFFSSGEISHIQEINKPCSVLLKGSSWWHESWTEPSPIPCSPLLLPGAKDIRLRCCMNEGPELFSPVCTLRHRHHLGTLCHPIASISTCRLLPLPLLLSWICVFFLFNQFKWSKLYFFPFLSFS